MAEARQSDRQRAGGRKSLGPLHGVPIALKDNIDTAGVRTTGASQVFLERVPAEDAEVARRLKVAGAVCLGKLNLDEMAFEGTGTTSFFGPVHNPWNLEHITGGSSAGSAAALAAGLCYASVGSDDGGSVRIPASFCGITGFKTSYGRVSTRGVIPSAYSLDTIGPMARTVEDAALILQVLAGFDPADAITSDVPVPDYSAALHQPAFQTSTGHSTGLLLRRPPSRCRASGGTSDRAAASEIPRGSRRRASTIPVRQEWQLRRGACCITRRPSFKSLLNSITRGLGGNLPSFKT